MRRPPWPPRFAARNRDRRPVARLSLALVVLAHVGLVLGSIRSNFVTFDEVDHIQAGVTYWETGDFSTYNANPPLTKLLQALPVTLAYAGKERSHLRSLDFATLTGVVEAARPVGLLWSLLAIWVIFRWAGEIYGGAAGFLGVVFWCFEPNITAHASLATADIAATAASLLATYLFVRHLRSPSAWSALLAGFALGVAQVTKFTLVALYGIWPLLFLARPRMRPDDARSPSLARTLWYAAVILASSVFVINYGYVFDGSFIPLSKRPFGGRRAEAARRLLARLGDVPVPLPRDYVAAFDGIGQGVDLRQPSYMAGRWRDHGGWWYYYLYALSVKVPLAGLALVAWGAALSPWACRGRGAWREEAMLWIPAACFLCLLSSQTALCKHMRYVFPMFPFVMIATSKLAAAFGRGAPGRRALLLALAAWYVAGGLSAYPHGISYFNELAGGPANGHRCLLDSNIDWGQDLGRLKRWLDGHPEARPLHLAILHSLDPGQFGVDYMAVPPGPDPRSPVAGQDARRLGPVPGYHALSINFLRGMIHEIPDGRGGWLKVDRHDYYDYFKHFTPAASCGRTISIYRISPEGADAVRRRLGLPPFEPGTLDMPWWRGAGPPDGPSRRDSPRPAAAGRAGAPGTHGPARPRRPGAGRPPDPRRPRPRRGRAGRNDEA